MELNVAYLSDGKLFIHRPGKAAELIESQFAQQMIERNTRSRQRNEWKTKGSGLALMQGRVLWGEQNKSAGARPIRITALTRGNGLGNLVYALDTDTVGGLFAYDVAAQSERRLVHRTEFRARDLCKHPAEERVALSLFYDDGSANIGIMELGGRGIKEVTEGDSLDQAPTWVAGKPTEIVYQSAGIGRNQSGHPVALGPYAIQRLNIDSGDFETLIEDNATDFLLPHQAADGSLYFIRRPYKPQGHVEVKPLKIALDVILLPFRLIGAIIHFLNFFTLMFSKKPLITAGAPAKDSPDRRELLLWGHWIDAEKAIKNAKGAAPSLVPKDWQLIRRDAGGQEKVLAEGVLSFDLCPDGVIFTNGTTIFHQPAEGAKKVLCEDRIIEHVTVM